MPYPFPCIPGMFLYLSIPKDIHIYQLCCFHILYQKEQFIVCLQYLLQNRDVEIYSLMTIFCFTAIDVVGEVIGIGPGETSF